MKTVIIGNGILALTTALRLAVRATPSDEIVIIGKRSRPGSATMAAAAMLNSFCEIEEGSLDSEIDMFRFELSHLATRMWPQFVLDHMEIAMGHKCLIEECSTCMGSKGACFELGTYLVNNTSADSLDDANYNAVLKALKDFYEPHVEVDPRDIPGYKPEQRHRATRAVYIPNEGWLNPKLTLRSLEVSVENFDCVEIVDDEVARIVKNGNAIESVVLKSGLIISGDKFLLATGATASELIDKSNLGISIPRIFHSVGISIQINSPTAPLSKAIRTPNRGLACGLYTVPFYTGPKAQNTEIIIGSSSYISSVALDTARVGSVQYLLSGAMDQINSDFYAATVSHINVGSRPLSADTYPVIGRTAIPNLIVATGTKRDGFHLSPLLSEVLTKLIYDEDIDPRYQMFSPQRGLVRELTREQAIESAVKHLMNASYQHGFVPSQDRLSDKIKQMHRNDLEALHDKVGAFDWGIPAELLNMYRYGHIKA